MQGKHNNKPVYDKRLVECHGSNSAKVFLINEAPGPNEAEVGIPLVGAQGRNLYRSLYKANIRWSVEFNDGNIFRWPQKLKEQYRDKESMGSVFEKRSEFLDLRRNHISCSNAYPYWPKSSKDATDFVDPNCEDVLSTTNLQRVQKEMGENHSTLLICGVFAWLLCLGCAIEYPSKQEGRKLKSRELKTINNRLQSSFSKVWYMGHTRRWALNNERTIGVLKSISKELGGQ